MNDLKKIVIIVADRKFNNLESGVFISQVVEWCRILQNNHSIVEILVCLTVRKKEEEAIALGAILRIEKLYSVKIVPFIRYNVLGINQLIILKYLFLKNIIKYLKSGISHGFIIHGRAFAGGWFACKIKKRFSTYRVIAVYDIRATVKEFLYLAGSSPTSKIISLLQYLHWVVIEHFNIKNSDLIFCVSGSLKNRLIQRNKCHSHKFRVIPCAVDINVFQYSLIERTEVRKALSITNEFIFVYSGGFDKWAVPDTLFLLFSMLLKKRPDVRLLILTYDREGAEYYCSRHKIDRDKLNVLKLHNNDVPKYLSAADGALLIRERNIINNVAAPIKFAEYIACGLPVLISANVGDYSDFVTHHKMGFVLNDNSPDEFITKSNLLIENWDQQLAEREKRAVELGKIFSKQNYIENFLTIYKNAG